jgi:hypothetical protein
MTWVQWLVMLAAGACGLAALAAAALSIWDGVADCRRERARRHVERIRRGY